MRKELLKHTLLRWLFCIFVGLAIGFVVFGACCAVEHALGKTIISEQKSIQTSDYYAQIGDKNLERAMMQGFSHRITTYAGRAAANYLKAIYLEEKEQTKVLHQLQSQIQKMHEQ